MNEQNSIKIPKSDDINIQLSTNAINFLDSQFIKNGEAKVIQTNFIFQILYSIKNLNWYCCCLLDQNSKYGGFCIKYEKKYGIPTEGDIIETNKIQIAKLQNKDTNLYFCEDVKKLKHMDKFLVDPKKLNSISKKRANSNKKSNSNYKLLENIKNNKNKNVFNSPQKISPSLYDLNFSDSKNNVNNDSKGKNSNESYKYTLISELTTLTNSPTLFLKCKFKSAIKKFTSKRNGSESSVQNYIFYDTHGDEIHAATFGEASNKYNNIINVGSIYEISKVEKQVVKSYYNFTKCQVQLIFNNYTKIIEKEDNGEFNNANYFRKNEFVKINSLTKDKNNLIVNVVGIILEDGGMTEKRKESGQIIKFRKLCIGDNTLHKINLKLWEEKAQEGKKYLKGDIVCIYYTKCKRYYNYFDLHSNSISQILNCEDPQKKEELKQFYKIHPNINEYQDMNFIFLNSQENIKYKFINIFIEDYIKEYSADTNYSTIVKLNGTVINFFHKESNLYEGCFFCGKKFENKCPTCLTDKKKLIFIYNVKIKDCSDYLWIDFIGEIGENFLGISPEDYRNAINDKNKIDEISKRILYNNYCFIGRYKGPAYDECHAGVFSVIQYGKIDRDYYSKEIFLKLKELKI